MSNLPVRNVIVAGVCMGVTAALIVWWLERFEADRFHREVRGYLSRYEEFHSWLRDQEAGGS